MTIGAYVCVEFPDANPFQRDSFETAMLDRQWVPMYQGFCAAIQGSDSEEVLMSTIESSIGECAEDAGIEEWDAICIIADDMESEPLAEPAVFQFAMN